MTAASIRPFSVSGDFARRYAQATAEAAQRGYITTLDETGGYARRWQSTVAGEGAFGL